MEFVNPITVFIETIGLVLNQPLFRITLCTFCSVFFLRSIVRLFSLLTVGSIGDFEDEDTKADSTAEIKSALESKPKSRRPSREDVPWEGRTW